MAVVMGGIGLALVLARGRLDGVDSSSPLGRAAAFVPLAAACSSSASGLYLTVRAVGGTTTLLIVQPSRIRSPGGRDRGTARPPYGTSSSSRFGHPASGHANDDDPPPDRENARLVRSRGCARLRAPMRDLTERALDTASARGASYADVRVVRRLEETISIKSGRVEGVASGETEGFGVRVLVDGAWGFARRHVLTAAEADRVAAEAVRIARASATALREPPPRRPAARPRHATRRRSWRTRSRSRSRPRSPTCSPPTRPPPGQGHRLHRVDLRGPARVEDVRRDRRQPDRAGHHPRRGRRSRPTPSTATSTSAGATPTRAAAGAAAATSTSAASAWPSSAEPLAEEAVELLTAPQCPPGRFTIVLDPSQLYLQVHESCGHPTELDRVFGTEASLRRHELPDDRQARRGLPLRLRPGRHRRRRDGAGRDGHVRLGRRGRRRPARAARPGRDLRRLPERRARPRRASAGGAAARCAPTAGTGSRSSG